MKHKVNLDVTAEVTKKKHLQYLMKVIRIIPIQETILTIVPHFYFFF